MDLLKFLNRGEKNPQPQAGKVEPSPRRVRYAGAQQSFIDPTVLQMLSNLQLVAKVVVEGFLSGLHRSPYHGFSVDFAEYREYSEGDDLRTVDWNVFARSDRYYVKKYEGETNTALHFLLDVSGSMSYGSGSVSKLDYARFLVASLAYFASRQKDAVGLYIFDQQIREFLPPRLRRTHMHQFLTLLKTAKAAGTTGWNRPLERVAQLASRRGMIVMVSDFYSDLEDLFRGARFFQSRGNEVILFQVLDPYELEFPFEGPVLLEDVETEDRVMVVPQATRKAYLENFQQHQERLREGAATAGIDYKVVRTDQPLDETLLHYLKARHRRIK
ncbi:MAG TPA: DUF58 domain-containing protein [Acidobacteriota bacterium]|jgi:uncharacterized protein (DUF58 family)